MSNFEAAIAKTSAADGLVPSGRFDAAGSPADRLPPEARAKYHAIESAAEDGAALCDASFERVQEAQADWVRAETRLRTIERNIEGRLLDEETMADARQKVEEARATLDRLREAHERRVASTRPARDVAFELSRYIERALAYVAEIEPAAPVAAPALKKGQHYSDAVAEVRARIEKLRADAQGVEDAPQPSEVAKSRARAEIERLAEKGRPGIMPLLESASGSIEWPKRYQLAAIVMQDGKPIGAAGRDGFTPDPLALVCWLHRDELLKRIEREIADRADDASALNDETREKKRRQVAASILAAEREEELLIEAAEEAGIVIARRPDADARAILGLADSCPSPRS